MSQHSPGLPEVSDLPPAEGLLGLWVLITADYSLGGGKTSQRDQLQPPFHSTVVPSLELGQVPPMKLNNVRNNPAFPG